jgi:putative flippase GtrA
VSEKTRFAAFLLTGGIAAGVNIAARWLLEFFVSFEAAVAYAFLVGLATGFLLARVFVFRTAAGGAHWQFVRYTLVNVVALGQVWVVSVGLARIVFPAIGVVWLGETAAHVIGVLSPVASSYVLHKRFSFRGADGAPAADTQVSGVQVAGGQVAGGKVSGGQLTGGRVAGQE